MEITLNKKTIQKSLVRESQNLKKVNIKDFLLSFLQNKKRI